MRVSVVMAVFNGAATLERTLDSIFAQTETDFELIAVDDGSTDATGAILEKYAARDSRIRVLAQQNAGLTAALMRGCSEARANVIARHDCGDRSHPDRLCLQLDLLESGHVLTGCATRTVDGDGDTLYVTRADGEALRHALLDGSAAAIRALPHHGTAMFRRDAYFAAGGYRAEFRLAQDLDLWIRMARLGTIAIHDEILYEAVFEPRSISGSSRDAQVELTAIAVALREGGDETSLLRQAERVSARPSSNRSEAAALYFIASCLRAGKNPKWRRTMRAALRANPFHLRAWASLLLRR
jgi:glycosyltransferase involved in cell wall biosynthesis